MDTDTDTDGLITIEKFESRDSAWPSDEDDPFFNLDFHVNKVEPDDNEGDLGGSDAFFQSDTEKPLKRIRKRKIKKEKKPGKSEGRLRVRYPCTKCSKIFHHVRLFKEHLQSHEPEKGHERKKYKCSYPNCEREFGSQIGVKNHLNYHSSRMKTEGHACLSCDMEFDSFESLSVHVAEIHEDVNDSDIVGHSYSSSLDKVRKNLRRKKWHKCDTCCKKFGNINIYKKHVEMHNDSGRNSKSAEGFKCSECLREFYSDHGLRIHYKLSTCSTSKEKRQRPDLNKSTTEEEDSSGKESKDSNSSSDESEDNEKSSENAVQCSECSRQFSGVLKLDIHLVSVHHSVPKCSQCGKIFPNGPRLFRHHNVHKLPSFKCPHEGCQAAFRTKEGLTVHKRKHEGILPHICKLCQQGFQTKQLCVQHRIDVHGQSLKPISSFCKPSTELNSKRRDTTYPCTKPDCDVVFKYSSSLVIHERKHEGLPPYVCPVCQQAFTLKQLCIEHRVDVHKENLTKFKPPGVFQCETCGNTFRNPYTLKNHIKREHSELKNFECDICGKKFSLEYDFKVHKSYHAGAGSFICEECGKSFNSRSDLVRHSLSHKPDSEKPFQCQICGKGFVRKIHFVEHGKLHSGEKVKVKRPRKSKKIEKEQPQDFSCQFCSKTWTSKDPLRSHLRRVHGRDSQGNNVGRPQTKLYNCDLCLKIFHKKVRLVDHCKNVHGFQYTDPVKVPPPVPVAKTKKSSTLTQNLALKSDNVITEISLRFPPLVVKKKNDNDCNKSITPRSPSSEEGGTASKKNYMGNSTNNKSSSEAGINLEDVGRSSPNSFADLPTTPYSPNISVEQKEAEMQPQDDHLPSSTTNVDPNDTMVDSIVVDAKQDESFENLQTHADTTKFEPSFESDMGLDDFFGPPSPEQMLQEFSNETEMRTVVKTERIEVPLLVSQHQFAQLSKKERRLVKKTIGSRIPVLRLQRLTTYGCKLCTEHFYRKDLYDKHCRSVRHWQAVRRIKEGGTHEKNDVELDIKRRCSICDIRFNTLKVLIAHYRIQHPHHKGFSCHLCGTSYFNYKHLRYHQVNFHKESDFQCVICSEKYSSYEVYREHITTAHKDCERKCPLCGKGFTRLKRLVDHCEAKHPGRKPFTCDICSTSYLRYKDYRNHRSRFHNDDDVSDPTKIRKPGIGRRKFPRTDCEICGKTFANLKSHLETHSGEKNHLCHLCGKSFGKMSNLIAHNQRHLGDARFPCTECPKTFYRRRDLKLHSGVHTKNHCCTLCPQKFATTVLLEKHQGLHNPKRRFSCTVCGYRFNFRGNLVTHVKKVHPDQSVELNHLQNGDLC